LELFLLVEAINSYKLFMATKNQTTSYQCKNYSEGMCIYASSILGIAIYEPCIFRNVPEPLKSQEMKKCMQARTIQVFRERESGLASK